MGEKENESSQKANRGNRKGDEVWCGKNMDDKKYMGRGTERRKRNIHRERVQIKIVRGRLKYKRPPTCEGSLMRMVQCWMLVCKDGDKAISQTASLVYLPASHQILFASCPFPSSWAVHVC